LNTALVNRATPNYQSILQARVFIGTKKKKKISLTPPPSPHTCDLLQVHQSQEKIARLEQEKEHWLLEAQLGKVRLEKESQRIGELEAHLAAATGGGALASAAAAALTTVAGAAAARPLTDGPAHDRDDDDDDDEVVQQKGAGKEAMLSTSLV